MATMKYRFIDGHGVRAEFARLTQAIDGTEVHLANLRRQRDKELKARAAEHGCAKDYRECESPTPTLPRVEEPTLRVRVRESFAGEWLGLPFGYQAGAVIDVPRSHALHAKEMLEIVDPATPLYRPALQPAWPRDVAITARPSGLFG